MSGMIHISGVLKVGFSDISELKGIILRLGAVLFYAIVIILNKKIKEISAYDKTIMQLGTATVVLLPYTFLTETISKTAFTPFVVLMLFIVGIVNTGIAYALYFGSMKNLKAQTFALFSYIDPVVAIILSAVLLRERMGIGEIVGAILVLSATIISEIPEKSNF
ncbi:MAG: DMT family transporter [Tissierellia bacterium]|nr:DMT family transporter [Tissierellia bacterium]